MLLANKSSSIKTVLIFSRHSGHDLVDLRQLSMQGRQKTCLSLNLALPAGKTARLSKD
jgi:hypothetical protein